MNAKRFVRLSISMTLVMLILVAAVQIAIDPLFQYHQPWFGLKPVIKNGRYQNAGIAKTFDYDNAIIGNSLSENFFVSDISNAFGGSTVKLTASGMLEDDYDRILSLIRERKNVPSNILMNMSPNFDYEELSNTLPAFLYDQNVINDVSYLYNFSILEQYTIKMIKNNASGNIPDYNTFSFWDNGNACSRDITLSRYERVPVSFEGLESKTMIFRIDEGLQHITKYIDQMRDTTFYVFIPPYSMLYWDEIKRKHLLAEYREGYIYFCSQLVKNKNVKLYFWTDSEMMEIICNLDNYKDSRHYSAKINREIVSRISNNEGLVTENNYVSKINTFVDYIDAYNFEKLYY